MENTTNSFEKFLEAKKMQMHGEEEIKLNISDQLFYFFGYGNKKFESFYKTRSGYFKSDYSKLELINTGNIVSRGVAASTLLSGISISTGIFGQTTPLLDFSRDALIKSIEKIKSHGDSSVDFLKYISDPNFNLSNEIFSNELYQPFIGFIGDTFLQDPSISASCFQFCVASMTIITGLYIKNGLKRDLNIENICKNIDKKTLYRNSTLEHASTAFKVLDSLYKYRIMIAMAGKHATDFLKNVTAPILLAIKYNVSHPLINKVKKIVGDDVTNKIFNAMQSANPVNLLNLIKGKKYKNEMTYNDMILHIEQKIKSSAINNKTNNPSELDMQSEISKIGKSVYETVQLNQLKRSLALSLRDCISAKRKIINLDITPLSNRKEIKNQQKIIDKEIARIKKIEQLSTLDKKEGRLSRFTLISFAASGALKSLNTLSNESIMKKNYTYKNISRFLTIKIEEQSKLIKEKYLSFDKDDNFYAQDIENMLIGKPYSFEKLFKNKVADMIREKTEEINNRQQKSRRKLI